MNQLPIIINNLQFAKQKQTLTGELDAMAFERLRDSLCVTDTHSALPVNLVRYQMYGWVDIQNRPFLKLTLEANLLMNCQRCLSPMSIDLNLSFVYLVTNQSEAEILVTEEMADEVDLVVMDASMDVGFVIEDELMMAFPIASVHAGTCTPLKVSSGDKVSPFAALERLKKSKN